VITERAAEFREALPDGGRLLGIDVGAKTIGLALCDSGWTIATPAELIRRGKF
jgi:putative holliday junction resolvase